MFGLINKPNAYSTQNEQKSKGRFLKEFNNSNVGNRLPKPDFVVNKPGLSLFYLGKLSNFFTQIIQHFITFSVHGTFFAGDFFQWFASTFKR